MRSEKTPLAPPSCDAMKAAVREPGGSIGHFQVLEPCSWTSTSQDCKQYISVVYKPPSFWYFVIAAQRDYDNYYLSMGLLVSRVQKEESTGLENFVGEMKSHDGRGQDKEQSWARCIIMQ